MNLQTIASDGKDEQTVMAQGSQDTKSEPASRSTETELPKNAIAMATAMMMAEENLNKPDNIKLWMRSRSFGSEALIEEMVHALSTINVKTMCALRTLVAVLRSNASLSSLKGYQPISVECMKAFLKAIEMPFYVGERFMYQGREMHVTGFDYFDKSLVLADRVISNWCSCTVVIGPTLWDSLSPVLGYCGSMGKTETVPVAAAAMKALGPGTPSSDWPKWVYIALIVLALVLLGCNGLRYVQQLLVIHKNQMNDINSRIEILQNQFPSAAANYLFEAAKRLQPTSG
jgi:hypothetical protein